MLQHLTLLLLAADPAAGSSASFEIVVVDEATGRGVPLVELTTTGGIAYVTDSAGRVAFDEPGLMNQRVFFAVKSHGYECKADGFGIRGAAFDVEPGGSAQIKLKRLNIAERLYRVTGQGIYRDTVLLGKEPPIREPLLNARVTGCDSVVTGIYRGKLHWFWGDTNQVAYLLGNYNVPGATSPLPHRGPLAPRAETRGPLAPQEARRGPLAPQEDTVSRSETTTTPERGVNLDYFVGEKGFAKAVCQMPGEGPTWIGGLAVLPDAAGRERMLTGYVKIKAPLSVYRRGIAVWNDETDAFDRVKDFESEVPLAPDGHTLVHRDGEREYVYFSSAAPLVRVPATAEAFQDLSQYEAFTCLAPGSKLDKPKIDRDDSGRVRYAWKKNTPAVGAGEQAKLVRDGHLKAEEALLQFRDAASGEPILVHNNSCTAWNEHRKKWVNILLQLYGTSMLGEIWYAEADSPLGPWVYAAKVVTHDKYTFYNPKQHPYFSRRGEPRLYFEGTYTHTFSGNEHRTPRYDYNQVMYRLDLDDPRLVLPAAVYDAKGKGQAADLRLNDVASAERGEFGQIAFFALDRPRGDAVAIVVAGGVLKAATGGQPKAATSGRGESTNDKPLFYALPADMEKAGITVPLYEYLGEGEAAPIYDIRGDLELAGYRRCPEPVCRVWPSPYRSIRK